MGPVDINAYSPDGRLYQIEYAMQAANLGTTTIGAVLGSSVVLVSEKKKVTDFQDSVPVAKHYAINRYTIFGYSGLVGDVRSIVKEAVRESALYMMRYSETIPPEMLLDHLCGLLMGFGKDDDHGRGDFRIGRPFGASIMVAAYCSEPQLFLLDPSGSYRRYKAKAIGVGAQSLGKPLLEKYPSIADFKGGVLAMLEMLREVTRDPLTTLNTEIVSVDNTGYSLLPEADVENLLTCLP